ncbi:low affinity immunoglobulin gamma Fc region receptor III-like [Lates calcarifer]|uniref:low affinity immunoglobulin gamma Fc region receptor III-like n=1 Tax=Lates calcarifer TaxID=8187 RepID=UPI0021D7AE2D|nr:low affinity immunoglobulin gamma Fc region receptor III-like [Lates calcarifer]
MEVTALCFRLMMVLMVLLDSNVHSQTDSSLFLIVPNRLQFFQYESVSFHCELPDGSSQLRGIRNNNQFVPNCDMRRTLTCNIEPAYDTDSGEYWCETEGGERSSTVNITVTAGPVILESPARPVMEGDDVTLHCRNKIKSINLQAGFYKDGILMKRSSVGEMTINNVSRSDEGLYRCSISGVGDSAESRLTVREPQPSHHRSSDILIPLWISVTLTLVLVLLLLLGLFHFRNHRVFLPLYSSVFSETQTAASHSGENQQTVSAEDDADGLTYAVVVKKRRKNEDAADAADHLSLCLQTNHSRDPQTEEGHKEQRRLTEGERRGRFTEQRATHDY